MYLGILLLFLAGCNNEPDIVDEYTDMVKFLVDHYYSGVTRYTTSAFLRMKLGDALKKRDVAPHIYENSDEARKALKKK